RRVNRELTDAERDLAAAELAKESPDHPGLTVLDLVFALDDLRPMALALVLSGAFGEDDVRQVAALGVMRAAQTYNPALGKFVTPAACTMGAALAHELAARGRRGRRPPAGVAVLSLEGGERADGEPWIDPPAPEPDLTPELDAERSAWLDRQAADLRREDAR